MREQGTSAPRGRDYRGVRPRRRRITPWPGWPAFMLVVTIVSLTASALIVVRSDYLRVQSVQIAGTEHIPASWAKSRLGLEGESMFRIDEDEIREAMLANPLVATVTVTRTWPHTVRISLTEREPWGHWQAAETIYVVDVDGVVIQGVPAPAGAPLILQTDSNDPLAPGDRVDASALRLVDQLLLLRPRHREQRPVSFDWGADTGLVVETETGMRVILGDARNLETKLRIWEALLEQAGGVLAVKEIDLRFGGAPAIRG